jgi:hypothetical protein
VWTLNQSTDQDHTDVYFVALEMLCVCVFTLEFLLRFASAPHPRGFLFDMYKIIYLLAVLPFYLEMMSGKQGAGGAIFRVS